MNRVKGGRQDSGVRISANQTSSKPATLNYPVFCLRHLQDGYDIEDCSVDDQRQLIAKLRRMSQMEWSQIEQADRHGAGKENIARNSMKRQVPAIVTDDVKLWALRFSGKKSMVGFRSGDVFHLLWLDHNFTAYKH